MKILISGANSFLAYFLSKSFKQQKDVELILTSRSMLNYSLPNVKTDLLDITNTTEVEYLIDLYKPDVVINMAAISNIEECQNNLAQCWEINTLAVEKIVRACNKNNCYLLQLSTDFVFDGHTGLYRENDIPQPLSQYGLSKLESEKIIKEQCKCFSIVRTCMVYGYSPEVPRSNFVLLVYKLLSQGKTMQVVDDQFRNPTYVTDLAEACVKISIEKREGVFHIAGDEYLSLFEFAQKIAEVFSLDKNLLQAVHTCEREEPALRPLRGGLNIDKAMLELNYLPVSLNQGIMLTRDSLV